MSLLGALGPLSTLVSRRQRQGEQGLEAWEPVRDIVELGKKGRETEEGKERAGPVSQCPPQLPEVGPVLALSPQPLRRVPQPACRDGRHCSRSDKATYIPALQNRGSFTSGFSLPLLIYFFNFLNFFR